MEVAQLNFFVALGAVGMQIGTIVLLALFFVRKQSEFAGQIRLVQTWALPAAFVLSLTAMAMSLTYSDILGFEPCPLCWWQRIFLYPQVLLFGMTLLREKYLATVVDVSIILSVLGACVALYNHLLQMMPKGTLPCPATGASCADIIIFEFGYVTFPMVALSLFALLIVGMLFLRSARQSM